MTDERIKGTILTIACVFTLQGFQWLASKWVSQPSTEELVIRYTDSVKGHGKIQPIQNSFPELNSIRADSLMAHPSRTQH